MAFRLGRKSVLLLLLLLSCFQAQVLPYDFDAYQNASERLYEILMRGCPTVEPVSCDEAFLDVTGLRGVADAVTAADIAHNFRAEIHKQIGALRSLGF